ncbi:hypothetical protein QWY75_04035 [Pontixanthobacter aestiaquae]|uniref:Tetratricopeptide repeat-containing protein n=1 Tax=Pontixanthobacter aestiaquae TaxID=1509367 RepID=A0A844Z8H9_9SPHN|nr:hypothetical protein [Pontixanthobacter aestiaquae]MDN3645377.1 hypothetical protein [Pontixanthobacter aestiaquae]MXO83622.1 hypothetical protein [Pontixanthobacter aestiaquae]
MFTCNRTKADKRIGSNIAFAVALMCGTALTAGVLETPAYAQKEQKPDYSKAFVEAYSAVEAHTKGLVVDTDSAKAAFPAMIAAISTADDKMAAGQMMVTIAISAKDVALQRRGYEMMLESGRASPEDNARLLFNSGQLAYTEGEYELARTRIMAASEVGYPVPDLENTISGIYFLEGRHAEGLSYLKAVAEAAIARGETPSEALIKRAFSAAYNEGLQDQALAWTAMQVQFYPTDANWTNVIALRREYFDEDNGIVLDLLRLLDRTAGLARDNDYISYIRVTNVRYPAETQRIVAQGLAAGVLTNDRIIVQEAQNGIVARVAGLRQDMPDLEADARAPGADGVDAKAAGDIYLTLQQPAKAEEMYAIAAGKPEVDQNVTNMRMGIAQLDLGKAEAAKASFAKVTGDYKHVADLWSVYADTMADAPAAIAVTEAAM